MLTLIPCAAFSKVSIEYDHACIRKLSDFRLMGVIDLRTEKDPNAEVKYRTLNHEGGMKMRVLEILGKDICNGRGGIWLYVILTAPIWTDEGEWIRANEKFLIFLPDDMPLFDFDE